MGFYTSFSLGIIVGIYMAQNYTVPDVRQYANSLLDQLKEYEKKKK
jgi:hypothetical protein